MRRITSLPAPLRGPALVCGLALAAGVVAMAAQPPGQRIPASCPQFPARDGPGVLCEDFDTDRDGTPGIRWSRLPAGSDPADPLRAFGDPDDDILGYTLDAGPSSTGTAARTCHGDLIYGVATCTAPVAEENDWHLHSPIDDPGDGYDPPGRVGIGAPDGGKAHSGLRSLHMGRHTDPSLPGYRDTIRFRQISAYVFDPEVNLGPASTLEFWHILQLPDSDVFPGFIPPNTTYAGGQLQISLRGADGLYERWQPVPAGFNGYTARTQEQDSLCLFDPGDDRFPPTDESLCDNSPMWSDMGDAFGSDATCTTDTDFNDPNDRDCGRITSCTGGPGCTENGSVGNGVWARSAFDLSPFAGRNARLRWVATVGGGWTFGMNRSFLEPVNGDCYVYYCDFDEGWWIDDIVLTDLRQTPGSCNTDGDQDRVTGCGGDCDDDDRTIWSLPGEPQDLVFAADGRSLSWSAPGVAGGDMVRYDVLRSHRPDEFFQSALCIASDVTDTSAPEPASPIAGQTTFYLVRAENGCPNGQGTLSTDSTGRPVVGRPCP